jgi:hypothetical protein
MHRSGEIEAVQINIMERHNTLEDFNGNGLTTPHAWAQAHKAKLAPTVFFFGPQGEEWAERLVGVAVPELYGDYLQARLAQARQHVRLRRSGI